MTEDRLAATGGPGTGATARVVFPGPGVVRIESAELFRTPDSRTCQRFLQTAFRQSVITGAALRMAPTPCVDLLFDSSQITRARMLEQLAGALERRSPQNSEPMPIAPTLTARDWRGSIRYRRYGGRITGWLAQRDRLGSLRLENPVLYRKRALCQTIERELMSVLGVNRCGADAKACRVDIEYDPRQISAAQLVEILDGALASVEPPTQLDRIDRELTICSASLPLAAAAQFALPPLLPFSAALLVYTALPSFRGAWSLAMTRRRLGVDALDSLVVLACLGAGQIFAGAVLSWCLGFGRFLARGAEDRSKKLLLGGLGKRPRYVWMLSNGLEIQIPIDRLRKGDVVVVHSSQAAPVDGVIVEGMAMIDQHALTGDSTPVEKGVGDKVFASSFVLAGKLHVSVERSGRECATAKIAQILNETAGYRPASQRESDPMVDKAVVPTLALGGLALVIVGPQGAAAVLNSDVGAGIRMAAPLAMLATLSACAERGVVVKDGGALDRLCDVDAVIFDTTVLLDYGRPQVGRIWVANAHEPLEILRYAAAAEGRFHHAIALAIVQKAQEEGLDLPDAGAAQYRVGHGIAVVVEGRTIRVGSRRFLELESVALTQDIEQTLDDARCGDRALVMVAVDGELGGVLELRAPVRPEVTETVEGLRGRGVKHITLLSSDAEASTLKLAAALGADRCFANVAPLEKASYVELLRGEGYKVGFVGDGVDDALAMRKADASISLRGAASIGDDAAHVVLMQPDLRIICELFDITRERRRNMRLSWGLSLGPNILCIVGVFTLGFGIAASMITSNVAALAALGNGVRPMRKVAAREAERRHLRDLAIRRSGVLEPTRERVGAEDDWDAQNVALAASCAAARLQARHGPPEPAIEFGRIVS